MEIISQQAEVLRSKVNNLRVRADNHIKKYPTPEHPSIETNSKDIK